MRFLPKILFALSIFTISMFSLGVKANTDPVALLDSTTVKMLNALDQNRAAIQSNVSRLYSLIDQILSPHVSYTEMARWVAGKNGWEKASEQQRKEFTNQFRVLLIRTYANALSDLKDVKVTYAPVRGDISAKSRIQVGSVVRVPGKENIDVSYRLLKAQSTWLVYDILVEGVSLLKGFQSQYQDDINKEGLSAVTQKMATLNKSKGGN